MSALLNFLNGDSIWIYAFIFFGKILEVAIATLRIVLISRGERTVGSFVAIAEVTIWLFVTGTVLTGFQTDLMKVVVFVVAFAIGNFIGSWLEEKIALGLSQIQIIVHDKESCRELTNVLRAKGFGVTTMEVHGMDDTRYMLLVIMKRKLVKEALALIDKTASNALVTIGDVEAKGGHIPNIKSRIFPLNDRFSPTK
ncbi:UPF0316 protein [Clostridia bacterium]|nr:UPF0316 protein [Clostridia bacterium]